MTIDIKDILQYSTISTSGANFYAAGSGLILVGNTFHASGLAYTSYVDTTSGNLNTQIIAVSGWNKEYTNTTSGNLYKTLNDQSIINALVFG